MEKKKANPVSRSVYQKLAEENKRLKADLKILCFNGNFKQVDDVRLKWYTLYKKEEDFNLLMKTVCQNYIREHPEYDITK